ncbi:hypothetical protein DRP53_00030 [candidate division WOR-3 bacterium]|uniref:Uncharacterized protein n=1 Tax=candidate division WOR-3 bacterium TaxID=2052148 RepID=A0A660SLU1_UNCW3|nr:MAG: hypothetical protein DRP53_00030 [candidate division WOR-3 bacterium]
MVILIALQLISGPEVYFHARANALVIRYPVGPESVAVYYSLDGASWRGYWMARKGEFYESYIDLTNRPTILALIFRVGERIDDNSGDLYLYELRWQPRSILRIDFITLERMLLVAKAKLMEPDYRDEAGNILDYLDRIVSRLPRYRKPFNRRVQELRMRVGNLKIGD